MEDNPQQQNFGDQLKCPEGHKAQLFCFYEECNKNALICRNDRCDCLPKNHAQCEFIYSNNFLSKIITKTQALSTQEADLIKFVNENDLSKITGSFIGKVKDKLEGVQQGSGQEQEEQEEQQEQEEQEEQEQE